MSVKDDLVAVTAQLDKVYEEVSALPGVIADLNATIADLEAVIAAGTVTDADLAPLREVAQRLDDIVPDAVVEPEPEPEPVDPEPVDPEPVDPEPVDPTEPEA